MDAHIKELYTNRKEIYFFMHLCKQNKEYIISHFIIDNYIVDSLISRYINYEIKIIDLKKIKYNNIAAYIFTCLCS